MGKGGVPGSKKNGAMESYPSLDACLVYLPTFAWQFFVTFLGWLSDLLERLSDLQLGDKKVTLNHLVVDFLW